MALGLFGSNKPASPLPANDVTAAAQLPPPPLPPAPAPPAPFVTAPKVMDLSRPADADSLPPLSALANTAEDLPSLDEAPAFIDPSLFISSDAPVNVNSDDVPLSESSPAAIVTEQPAPSGLQFNVDSKRDSEGQPEVAAEPISAFAVTEVPDPELPSEHQDALKDPSSDDEEGHYSQEAKDQVQAILQQDIDAEEEEITRLEAEQAADDKALKAEMAELAEKQKAIDEHKRNLDEHKAQADQKREDLRARRTKLAKILQEL